MLPVPHSTERLTLHSSSHLLATVARSLTPSPRTQSFPNNTQTTPQDLRSVQQNPSTQNLTLVQEHPFSMRSAIVVAALAAGALAVPFNEMKKRAVVTDTQVDVVYVTDITTVTVNGPAPSANNQNNAFGHFGHGHHHHAPAPAQPTEESAPAPSQNSSPPPSNSNSGGSSGAASGAVPTSYSEIVVTAHNLHRKNHSAPDIAWDDSLAASAATIAASCVYAHNV